MESVNSVWVDIFKDDIDKRVSERKKEQETMLPDIRNMRL